MCIENTKEKFTAGTVPIRMGGELIDNHCVGIEGSTKVVLCTGFVGGEDDAESARDAKYLELLLNAAKGYDYTFLHSLDVLGETFMTSNHKMALDLHNSERECDRLRQELYRLRDGLESVIGQCDEARRCINHAEAYTRFGGIQSFAEDTLSEAFGTSKEVENEAG